MNRLWMGVVAAVVLVLSGCVAGPVSPGGGIVGGVRPPTWPGTGIGGIVRCESVGLGTRRCPMDTRNGVRLVRHLSTTACIQGRSWGWDRTGVWVSQGCRAEFQADRFGSGGVFPPVIGGQGVRCESISNRRQHCRMDTRNGVRLVRQLSGVTCLQGRNWGWDRNGVWVSQGCRGEFMPGRGSGGNVGGGTDQRPFPGVGVGVGQTIRCESLDGRQRRCNVQVNNSVQLVRQLSNVRCQQGQNWGWDRNGVWVSGGCRAEFSIR